MILQRSKTAHTCMHVLNTNTQTTCNKHITHTTISHTYLMVFKVLYFYMEMVK